MSTQTTQFSHVVLSAMEAQNKTIRSVAESAEMTYEHTRRVVKGYSLPTNNMVRALSQILNIDFNELSRIAQVDRLRAKFPKAIAGLTAFPKRLQPLADMDRDLTESDINELIAIASLKVKMKSSARHARPETDA